jgi:hypothetical protein
MPGGLYSARKTEEKIPVFTDIGKLQLFDG